jgi:putative GTP pyrophosphokinase
LRDAAHTVRILDMKMELINNEISKLEDYDAFEEDIQEIMINNQTFYLPKEFFE